MFFNCLGLNASSTTQKPHTGVTRPKLVMIALAVALAAPIGVSQISRLYAQDAQPQPAAAQAPDNRTPLELLRDGLGQYRSGQYEEALETLGQVDAQALNEADRKALTDTTKKAEFAASQRKAARDEFQRGEAALAANRPLEAIEHYRKAATNTFADDGTKRKSREQIALAESANRVVGSDMAGVYNQAVADFEGGNLQAAKEKFQRLQDANYNPGGSRRRPAEYLQAINQPTPAQPTPAPTPTPEPLPPTPGPTPQPAPPQPVQPQAAQPGWPEQPQTPGYAESVESQPRMSARQSYLTARRQYNEGDWISARKNFRLAQELGYKKRLFEDSPGKYLARMDKKEEADAAKVARQAEAIRRQQALAQQSVMPAPAPQQPIAQVQPPAPQPTPPQPVQPQPAPPLPPAPQPITQVEPTVEPDLQTTAKVEEITSAAQQAEARRLVEQAREAQEAGQYADALEYYSQASNLDPQNEQARAGRGEMVSMTGRADGGTDILRQRERLIKAQREAIRYEFNQAIQDADAATEKGDFETAQAAIRQARAARNMNPNIFSEAEIESFEADLNATQLKLAQAQDEAERQAAGDREKQIRDDLERQRAQADADRRRTIADLTAQAKRLINEGRYLEALGVVDQIISIEPTNDYASGVRPLIEDRAILLEQRRYREEFDRQYVKQLNAAAEKLIPYDDILRYPSNWPDISDMRDSTTALERGVGLQDQAIQQLLDTRLPVVKFDAIAFDDVVEFFRDMTGANIFVVWRALEGAGIDRTTPVTARLSDVKFSKALETILDDVGGGTVPLGYTVDEGVITISTIEDLSRNVLTRTYDIRDLIFAVRDYIGPSIDLSQQQQQGGGGRSGGGGGGQSLFGGSGAQQQTQQQVEQPTREELVTGIQELIQDVVDPESWRLAGGTVGSIRELSGQLIVTQTPENHRQILSLLEQLREARAIQITVEARFLTVGRNFLEDVGFDVDFVFNTDDDDPDGWGPIPVINSGSAFTGNPQTGVPGSIGSVGGTTDPVTGQVAGGSLVLSGTYLDDFAVTFLPRAATQAAQNTSAVNAPRITLFNGQSAYVIVARQFNYVSDLEPVVGTRAAAFDPTISTLQSGVQLRVQATVSADRRYVTMNLEPTLSTLVRFDTFTVQSAAETQGDDDDTTPDPTGGIIAGTIQLPVFDQTSLGTTVSVPDGGTLLLGGQTLAGEVDREAGAPIVSKIPFLKRLFTNRAMAKDEQILLILVKPTIIIQREQEQKQFPLLSTRVAGE